MFFMFVKVRLTLVFSTSDFKISVEADPLWRKWEMVSFSRAASRKALAVFAVSFREWTKIKT